MNTIDQKKSIDLTNGRVVSGMICAGFVPSVFFIMWAIIESYDEAIFFLILLAIVSAVPGFIAIFIPCFILLWIGKTKPVWFAVVPPGVVVPLLLFFNPYEEFLRINPVVAAIASGIAAFSGLLCWFISVRLDSQFQSD